MDNPDLTIVTGTRHRSDSLKRFLKSACEAATVPTKILVADASDHFVTSDIGVIHGNLSGSIVAIDIYHESPRLNPNRGYDQLCRKATTKYVAFFNDDAECVPGWDKIAVDFMDAHEEVGIGCLFWHDPGGTPYLQSLAGILYPNFGIIRKSAGDIFGWFDTRPVYIPELEREEELTFYGMDTGLAFKCVDAGFACVPVPGSLVKHHREQDEERRENMAKHLHDDRRMPPGSLPGTILRLLWNGNDPNLSGYAKLREKAAKFSYLTAPIDRQGNVTG